MLMQDILLYFHVLNLIFLKKDHVLSESEYRCLPFFYLFILCLYLLYQFIVSQINSFSLSKKKYVQLLMSSGMLNSVTVYI
jgi:hypothetical protein